MTLLSIHNVVVERPKGPRLAFPDFAVGQGEHVLLLGPSGCGKTTLLSVLAGLLTPQTGNVLWKGKDFYALDSALRDRLRGREFGFVFQTLHLIPSLSLYQNIALAGDMAGVSIKDGHIESLLSRLGLSDKAHRKPDALSQGEQQRGAMARAVLNFPLLIIADEPTSALDDANAINVIDLMLEQAKATGAALLVATHDGRITSRFQKIIRLDNQMMKAAA